MNIKSYELKKAVTSPIIIGLVIISIFFNIFIIFNNTYCNDELLVLNKIISQFGYKIDENMIHNFKKYYDKELDKLNQITYEKTSKTYKSALDFLNEQYLSGSYNREDIFTKEDMDFINELRIIETYYYAIGSIDDVYEKINPLQIAETEIQKYRLNGKAADTVTNEYKKFDIRFSQLVKNGEHKNLFFMGHIYEMHSRLFKTLFRSLIFEIVILVVLITAYLMNYEFDNNTQLVTYSTKRGRDLIVDKLYTSIIANIIAVTIIIATGLSVYFIAFDYTGLWNVPISSYFNADSRIYMSWWNMSFFQYLLCSIGIVYVVALLFTGITFIISKFVRNSYIAFFIFLIIYGIALLLPSIAPTSSNSIFVSGFTPFTLAMNPHVWFMESGAFTTFKYYELITVSIWSVVLLIFISLGIRRFKKQDLC